MSGAAPVSPRAAIVRFAAVALALFCIQLDFFALGLALPVIAAELHETTTDLQWALSGYMLALGALIIPASRLGDVLGRRRVLLSGVALFGLSSVTCALAQSAGVLIGARVIQGVGAALILPVAFSLVSNATTADERPRVLGFVVGLANLGTALGPIVGGVLASTVGWRWVFWVNVPFAVVALLVGRRLPDSRDPAGRSVADIDWLGVVLVALGVAAITLGIDSISARGLTAGPTLAALGVGVVLLVLFAMQNRRHPWPLVSAALVANRAFLRLLGAGTFANTAYCLMMIVVTIQLQQVRGMSAALAGIVFAAPALATALCGPLSGRLAGRYPGGQVMAVSIVVGALGLLLQAAASSLAADVVGLALSGLAFGMGYTFTTIATQSVLPVKLAGEASGLVLTTLVTFGAIGVVVGAIALELFGAPGQLDHATTATLAWTGVVALVIGLGFGWTQRSGVRIAVPA